MRIIGNILWLIFAGIWLAFWYALSGLILCITIIGIPFGIQAFKLAGFTLWPFGRSVARTADGGCLEVVFNIVWLMFFGWELFLMHLIAGAVLCFTIIGIPFGIQAFKLSMLALWPFGHSVVRGQSGSYAVPINPAQS